MTSYRHTQAGWLSVAIALGVGIFGLVLVFGVGLHPALLFAWLVVVPVLITFNSLTTEVEDGTLRLSFGVGWIQRQVELRRVAEVRVVRNRWFYGWGIRLTPHGWLWNVSGLDAVELVYLDGSKFRVGTDEPRVLAQALQAEIDRRGWEET